MSTESEDERIARWERGDRQAAAMHRRRMRWWRHMREYVSMKRLFVNGLVAVPYVRPKGSPTIEGRVIPDHPPWSHDRAGGSNWWPRYRWNRQG